MSHSTSTRCNPPKDPLDHEPAAVTYARDQAGLTKTQLAKACGVSVSLISEIESGTRNATPAMIRRLAAAMNCPRVVLERKRETAPINGPISEPISGPVSGPISGRPRPARWERTE